MTSLLPTDTATTAAGITASVVLPSFGEAIGGFPTQPRQPNTSHGLENVNNAVIDNTIDNMPATPHTATSFSQQEGGQRGPSPSTVLSHVSSVEFSSMRDTSRTTVEEGDAEAEARMSTSQTTGVHEHEVLGRLSEESESKRMSHLPSPPLTRVGTNESVPQREIGTSQGKREDMEDGLGSERMEGRSEVLGSDLDREGEELAAGLTMPVEGEEVDKDDRASSVVGAGRAGTSSPSSAPPSQMQFRTKTPPSPHPWDVIHPPQSSRAREYGRQRSAQPKYTAKETDKFAAMQSQMTARSLIPKSSYYFGPPAPGSAYGSRPIGQIGLHHPREILRVERDYTGGELVQFAPIYPLELEGRVSPKQFYESISAINELLVSAHSLRHSFFDSMLNVFTLHLAQLFITTHYEKEMQRLQRLFEYLNAELFNPVGLNILWPRKVAFLFLEIEYY